MPRTLTILTGLVLSAPLLAGCGTKGPLFIPPPPAASLPAPTLAAAPIHSVNHSSAAIALPRAPA